MIALLFWYWLMVVAPSVPMVVTPKPHRCNTTNLVPQLHQILQVDRFSAQWHKNLQCRRAVGQMMQILAQPGVGLSQVEANTPLLPPEKKARQTNHNGADTFSLNNPKML